MGEEIESGLPGIRVKVTEGHYRFRGYKGRFVSHGNVAIAQVVTGTTLFPVQPELNFDQTTPEAYAGSVWGLLTEEQASRTPASATNIQ